MILFFDTETTGLADFEKRASDPSQPHMVSLAVILSQNNGTVAERFSYIVKPNGWTIPKEASDIHGITDEIAFRDGHNESFVATHLFNCLKSASLIVGFNIKFDKFIARIAMRRYGLLTNDLDTWWKELPTFCVMRQMTDICQLPNVGRGGKHKLWKFPKLQEAYTHAYGREFAGAHGAAADVAATHELYFWLKKGGAK